MIIQRADLLTFFPNGILFLEMSWISTHNFIRLTSRTPTCIQIIDEAGWEKRTFRVTVLQAGGIDSLLETLTDVVAAGTIAVATAIGIADRGHNLYYAKGISVRIS